MNKSTYLLVTVLATGLIGCSSGDGGNPITDATSGTTSESASGSTAAAGSTAGATAGASAGLSTTGTTVGTTVGDTAGNTGGDTSGTDTDTSAGGTTDAGTNGEGAQGANPGSVPASVIAELTTLNVTDIDSVRGHKIFAGDEITGFLATIPNAVEHSYFNLTFPCTGEAVFENFPAPQFASFAQPVTGNFIPGFVDGSDSEGDWDLDAITILSGDADNGITTNDITVDQIVNGDLIVGTSSIESLFVTRIVQFEQCN